MRILTVALLALSFIGCASEEASSNIDNAMDKTGDALNTAADATGDDDT